VVQRHGVTIVGIGNLPATVARDASTLYARNVLALVKLLVDDQGRLAADPSDEVLTGCLLVHRGEVRHAPTAELLAGRARIGARS
jgi:NAD(P) transhydrogenase subunit alpha